MPDNGDAYHGVSPRGIPLKTQLSLTAVVLIATRLLVLSIQN